MRILTNRRTLFFIFGIILLSVCGIVLFSTTTVVHGEVVETGDVNSTSALNYELTQFVVEVDFNQGLQNEFGGCVAGNCASTLDDQTVFLPLMFGPRQMIACTDFDQDNYAIDGRACGAIDCDDTNPFINPASAEICENGIDDDCDGLVDLEDPVCCTDADGDAFAIEGGACGLVDCDDDNPFVNPGTAEVCDNGLDDNCNGFIDTDDSVCPICTDSDGDGFAIEGGACGLVDCDDNDPFINPAATEVCDNGSDDDCNG